MVYSWGCNLFSRLGQLTNSSQLAKVRIPREVNLPEKVTKIGIGTYHIIAVTESGSAYSWGKGNQGQLGVDKLELEVTTILFRVDQRKSAANTILKTHVVGSHILWSFFQMVG